VEKAFSEEVNVFYYDLKLAREQLPWLRRALERLKELKTDAENLALFNDRESVRALIKEADQIISEISKRGVILRDISIGLVDFPSIINGKPAYLCWKIDEEDISFWHGVDEGFSGRKRITKRTEVLEFT
jgi:hypothetical protein